MAASLRCERYFFERIRPIVEQALRDGATAQWPLITLNLDLKTNEPEHHRALWDLLGEYEGWLTTAKRTARDASVAALDVRPVLVLTGESEAQAQSFHDAVPVGGRLRLFGAMPVRPPVMKDALPDAAAEKFWRELPTSEMPKATNYRRWWNAPWSVVEAGGQAQAGEWTSDDEARLRTLVRNAHAAGLWVRMWTVNGHPGGAETETGWSPSYNIGSLDAARARWRASVAAGVDFIASDQYELMVEELPDNRPRLRAARALVLEGTLGERDRLAWLERTFEVPPLTARLDVDVHYTGRAEGTAIEFGLYDPVRFRGASRTSKAQFFVSRTAATPSYTVGDLPAGTWRLLMGVPSVSANGSRYRIVVRFTPEGPYQPTPLALPAPVTHSGPRWYQGDFHSHSQHSDGFGCAVPGGSADGPCSAHQIAAIAAERGLDFVAVTDHNTTSHHAGLVEVQARHPALLLLRGQEMTTFYGHANVFGTSEILDFRIGPAGSSVQDVFAAGRRLGALISINHPRRETGDRCTGCGWSAPLSDYGLVDAIEVVNGRTVSGPTAGEPFWHARLNEGHRLAGIGGGDDHAAGSRPDNGIGTPTTAVYADALTEAALLEGIRAGRVVIKTRGPGGPDLEFAVPAFGASMGDVVRLAAPTQVTFRVAVRRARGQRVVLIHNGRDAGGASDAVQDSGEVTLDFPVRVLPGDWVRVNLRDDAGITAMGNPIYFR